MTEIPIIDFAKVSESNEEISEKVKCALANVGFLYIVNHGVDMSKVKYNEIMLWLLLSDLQSKFWLKVRDAFAQSKLFFEQPDDVKRIFLQNPPVTGYAGWVEPGQELYS